VFYYPQTFNKLQQERDILFQKHKKLTQENGRLLHVDRELIKAKKDIKDLRNLLQQSLEMNQTKVEEHQKGKKGKKDTALEQTVEQYKELLRIANQHLEIKDKTVRCVM